MALNVQGESSSSSISGWKYHVFLSFRGEDTRANFTEHLYASLQRRGITVFRDVEEIQRGQVIPQQLLTAVEDSLFSIVVLSRNYAFSSWCLDELKKILEARKKLGRQVFPIFYGVDRSDVRHQRGSFGEALAIHEERFNDSEGQLLVQQWRDALTQVANLSGLDSRGRKEADLIEDIVESIWGRLSLLSRGL